MWSYTISFTRPASNDMKEGTVVKSSPYNFDIGAPDGHFQHGSHIDCPYEDLAPKFIKSNPVED
ncbi:hypothetical protein OUZ56_026707 [Daphnia magna]|uniref:Uncharacterized protein n=1 Tax=Daphnia magna TaxID=35525 RepID=A0ABQ9ZMJ7_9CRUS|nr:hypothetical protein OUZ56_026707 [Daphnia magna]